MEILDVVYPNDAVVDDGENTTFVYEPFNTAPSNATLTLTTMPAFTNGKLKFATTVC